MPGGIPRWIRIYWDKKDTGHYTVEFTRPQDFGLKGYVVGREMSDNPYHPQGVGLSFEYPAYQVGRKRGHWGVRVKFQDVPPMVQKSIIQDYCDWRGIE